MSTLGNSFWRRGGVAMVGAVLLATSIAGLASAKAAPAGTTLLPSTNPVTLTAGVDVTLTSVTTANGAAASQIDEGRITFQLAVDGEGRPVPAARVVSWLALNAPGARPQGGMASLAIDLDGLGFSAGAVGGFRALFVPGAKAGKPATHRSATVDVAAALDVVNVARVEIQPATTLLTSPSDSRELRAVAYDADGNVVAAPIQWSSSRPTTVSVAAGGRVTAGALGSAQIVAEAGGKRSLPALVVVAFPAPGAILVDDAQVVGDPVATVPGSDPSLANTYDVLLRNVSVVPGNLVVGTGEKAVGGRVVTATQRADGTSLVTLSLVPLPELLPGLRIDETFDLSTAEVRIPDDVTAIYDVVRTGDTFEFTPKPGLTSLTMAGSGSGGFLGAPIVRPGSLTSGTPEFDGPGSTEFNLGPFECKADVTTVPLQLTEAPALSITLSPSLDVLSTDGELERFVVVAQPSATFNGNLAFTSSFEGKVECTKELFEFNLPVGGLLSLAIGGIVPVGVGFEIGGKVTVANLTIGAEATMGADVEAGITCPPGATCGFHKSIGNFRQEFKPNIQLPSLGQVRLEPSFTPFAFMKLAVGSPLLAELRVEAIEAKVGFQLAGNFAPRETQILDPSYASDYKLTFQVSAQAAPDLGDVASALGITELATASLSQSFELARSATGSVIANAASFATGETAHVRVRLNSATLTFLGLENVDEVLLVRYAGGIETIVARQAAASGQADYELSFVATGPTNASELFAFVEPKVIPELLALEIGAATPIVVAISPSSASLAFGASQQFTATVTGTSDPGVDWTATCGSITAGGLYTAPASGDECTVTATSLSFTHAAGTAAVELAAVDVAVTPISATLAPGATQQFTATVTGAENDAVTWSASCGSITSTGLFTAPDAAGPCLVTAASLQDPGVSDTATVTIQPAGVFVTVSGQLHVTGTGAACGNDPAPFVAPSGALSCTATIPGGSATSSSHISHLLGYSDADLPQIQVAQSVDSNASYGSGGEVGRVDGTAYTLTETRFEVTETVDVTFTVNITDVDGSACGAGSSAVDILVNGRWYTFTENGSATLRFVTNRFFFLSVASSSFAFAEWLGDGGPEPCPSGSGSGSVTVDVTMVPYQE